MFLKKINIIIIVIKSALSYESYTKVRYKPLYNTVGKRNFVKNTAETEAVK